MKEQLIEFNIYKSFMSIIELNYIQEIEQIEMIIGIKTLNKYDLEKLERKIELSILRLEEIIDIYIYI